jgi:hypothetical protein
MCVFLTINKFRYVNLRILKTKFNLKSVFKCPIVNNYYENNELFLKKDF